MSATMRMRMKTLLPVVVLVAALGLSNGAGAQQSGTADDAKALLARAAAAVRADKAGALARFDNPNGGFKDRDLYVFCFDRNSGIVLAGPSTVKGKDERTLRDANGKMFGQEMFANVKDGEVITEEYVFPSPNSTIPVDKQSFVEGLGDVACGVGYYPAFAQAPPEWSRAAREQHACGVIMGLHQPGDLYNICIGSLAKSLYDLDKARQISSGRDACAQQGLKPGTPSFAACVETGPGF
jgi:hypothetical protein